MYSIINTFSDPQQTLKLVLGNTSIGMILDYCYDLTLTTLCERCGGLMVSVLGFKPCLEHCVVFLGKM